MSIAENLQLVRRNIAAAAAAAGRAPDDILLVGATKMNDAARVQEAIAAGLTACGENRVQELTAKNAEGAYRGAQIHFIGHLQKNKVKNVVGVAELIHSVDSLELLAAVDRQARSLGITQDVLLEVNTGGEASKSGFSPDSLEPALLAASNFSAARIRGLMTIPPICTCGEENIPYFQLLKQLSVDICMKKYDNVRMDFLSMGMSGDYEAAIACGANIVRVGTAVFGQRIYPAARADCEPSVRL